MWKGLLDCYLKHQAPQLSGRSYGEHLFAASALVFGATGEPTISLIIPTSLLLAPPFDHPPAIVRAIRDAIMWDFARGEQS
jgi:hypothetical protein